MGWLARTAASWRALRTGAGPSRRPIHETAGSGRRALSWQPGNPGALATTFATGHDLRVKSRDLVRRNAWAGSAVDGVVEASLEPGTMQRLKPGQDVRFAEPADAGSSYEGFFRNQLRAVATAAGVTYEQLSGDLTQVNYSSIRAGLLEFRRRCETIQHAVVVHQLCRPVWREWMATAVLAGALDAPGFAADPASHLAAKWIPQGWQWVDPEKEFKAVVLAIRAGLMSRSEAISAFGYDAEEIDREIAADNARADALGLVLDSDPRKVARTGAERDRDELEPNSGEENEPMEQMRRPA